MKSFEEIKQSKRMIIAQESEDGFSALIQMPMWKGTLVCSIGAGWEHVSVRPEKSRIMPSWDDMCMVKDMFWNDNEAVIQIHPPKDQYVNNMGNCLHLWRCTYKDMVLPPSCLVGIREGQTRAELMKEIKEAYEIAGEKF